MLQDTNDELMGIFSETITTLSPATHYYVQAYATNSQGTSYGGVVEFTTLNSILSITRSDPDPTKAISVTWDVKFSAIVTGLTSANFTLANLGLIDPAITAVSDKGENTWSVTANTGAGAGTLGLNLTGDAGLNTGLSNPAYTGEIYTVDHISLTVTINQAEDQPDPASSSPINFTAVFNKPVTGFGSAGVSISGTAGAITATVTGSGAIYNVAVSGMTGAGTVIVSVPAGVAQDAVTNGNAPSSAIDNTVIYTPTNTLRVYFYFPLMPVNAIYPLLSEGLEFSGDGH